MNPHARHPLPHRIDINIDKDINIDIDIDIDITEEKTTWP